MAFSLLPTDVLLRPSHLHPGVDSPETYLLAQRVSILAKLAQLPNLRWRMPFLYVGEAMPVKVSESAWQVVCDCGNTPLYDPEWALAACFTCGAIYRQAPPTRWREIERVLVNRRYVDTRHMLPGQTVDELRAENRAHGEPD